MRTGNLLIALVLTLVLLATAGFGLLLDRSADVPEHVSSQGESGDCSGLTDYSALIESTAPVAGGEATLNDWADELELVDDDAIPEAAGDYHERLIAFLRAHAEVIDEATPEMEVITTPGDQTEFVAAARALDTAAEEGYAHCGEEWPESMLPRELIEATPSSLEDADWDTWPEMKPSTPETFFA